jgi:hypothetical protein
MRADRSALAGVLFALVVLPLVSALCLGAPPPNEATSSPRLRALLKERRDALQAASAGLLTLVMTGKVTLQMVLDTGEALLETELELATTPAERVAAVWRAVEHAQLVEQVIAERFEGGAAASQDLHQSWARRVAAEKRLLVETAQAEGRAADPARLRAVQKQQRDALLAARDGMLTLVMTGKASLEMCLDISDRLMRVELDLAATPADRVRIRQDAVEAARLVERLTQERFEAGAAGPQDVAQVRARRAAAEVRLLIQRAEATAQPADPARLRAARKERRDALRTQLDGLFTLIQTGKTTFSVAVDAREKLLEAELDLCDEPAERTRLHEGHLQFARPLEQSTRERFEAGAATHHDAAWARAVRVKAEIDLFRERLPQR